MVKSTEFDRRIFLQQRAVGRGTAGAEVAQWSTLAEVWASLAQQTGREFVAGAHDTDEARAVFKIRWRDDVTRRLRVLDKTGQAYRIVDVRELGRRDGLELHCAAIVGENE